jgi:hypothetical protein
MNALLALVLTIVAQSPVEPTAAPAGPAATAPTAATAPPAAAVPLMMVLDVAGDHVSLEQRQGLTESLSLALAQRLQLEVQSPRSLMDRVNFAEQQQQAGCDASACMAEIANAMGARFVVFTRIVKLGDEQVLRADVFDNVAGRSVALSVVQGGNVGDLLRRLPALVDALVLESQGALPLRAVERRIVVPDKPMSALMQNGLVIGGVGLGASALLGTLFIAGSLQQSGIGKAGEKYAQEPDIDNARAVVDARGSLSESLLVFGSAASGCLALGLLPAVAIGAGMVIVDAAAPQQESK